MIIFQQQIDIVLFITVVLYSIPGGPQLCRFKLQPAPTHTCLEASTDP